MIAKIFNMPEPESDWDYVLVAPDAARFVELKSDLRRSVTSFVEYERELSTAA